MTDPSRCPMCNADERRPTREQILTLWVLTARPDITRATEDRVERFARALLRGEATAAAPAAPIGGPTHG